MQKTVKSFILKFLFFLYLLNPANAAFEIKASTAILQDYLSGEILYEKDADLQIYPASMTKIMTSIIAFELIKKGELSLMINLWFQKMHGDYQKVDTHQCLL